MSFKKENAPRSFWWIYFSIIALVVLLVLWCFISDEFQSEEQGAGLLGAALGFIFFGTPLCILFVLANVWGFLLYKRRRVWYLIIALVVAMWSIRGVDLMINMPLP